MALDPQVARLLERRAARPTPPGSWPASAELVDEITDLLVPGPGGDLPVRSYRPSAVAPLPIVVFFHGGGFVGGDLDLYDDLCRGLANASGCLVVAVAYRLAPEHRFPAAAEDALATLRWAAANAASIGGDPDRLAVVGDSAGGNLAAVAALQAAASGEPTGLRLQVLLYPMITPDFDGASTVENATGYLATYEGLQWCWAQYLRADADRSHPHASPLAASTAQLAGVVPAIIVTAEYDPLRDEGEAYGERLREAGVAVAVERAPGMIHGFISLRTWIDEGERALRRIGAAIREALA